MATRGRREFLVTLNQFAGANFDADAEDLGKFAPVQENLLVGAGMTDLRTALGLQKLNLKALTGATDDQVSIYVTENSSNFAGQLVCVHTHQDGYEKPRLAKQSMSDGLTASETARFGENWGSGWGPVYMPWLVAGTRLHVVGHAGMRPRLMWRDIVKNTGVKGLEYLWTATAECPGTVATNGTTTLTGTNTTFLTTFKVGDTIVVSGETVRTIATIGSNTSLTVTVAFSTTASGLTYTFGTAGSMAAGVYEYGVTLYDSVLARDGEMIRIVSANVAATGKVTIAGPVVSGHTFFTPRAYTTSGEPTGAHVDYYDFYRFWRRGPTQTDFYLVGEVAKASVEASDYSLVDSAANPGATVYIPNRRCFPSFRWCVFHQGRFVGLGLPAWTVAGTYVHCVNAAKPIYATSLPPYFRPWMDSRTIRIKDQNGTWVEHLIDYVWYDSTASAWMVALATAWAGTTGDYAWELMGSPNTAYFGNRVWGSSEMFCMDGTMEIAVNEGDGQEIVCGLSMMHRLMVYKTGSIWAVTGGAWTDPEDSTPVQNDLDYYLVKDGVGIPGPYCVTPDADGAHWIFDGYSLLRNTGTDVVRVAEDKTRGFFSGLDSTRFHEAVVMFDTASNTVLLCGFYKRGREVPSEALVYDVKTGAVCPLTDFYVSGGGVVAQKW